MPYHPVFLDPRRRRGLVVIGGAGAGRKITGLLGADVTVVAQRAIEAILRLAEEGRVTLRARDSSPDDVLGIDLAVRILSPLAAAALVEPRRCEDHGGVNELLRSLVGETVTLERPGVGWG